MGAALKSPSVPCSGPSLASFATDRLRERPIQYLFQQEDALQFATVAEKFVVIEADTVTTIVDPTLIQSLQAGQVDWQRLQRKSVSIRREYIKRYQMRELGAELYAWTRPYDRFLGYMAGVIQDEIPPSYTNEERGA